MHYLQQYLSKVVFVCAALLLGGTLLAQAQQNPGQAQDNCGYDRTTKLYFCDYGSGDPMLFIHGLGGTSYSWRHMIPEFSKTHRVITIDLLGAGKSPKPHKKEYSILHQGELIQKFIDERNLTNLTLVGNSYGGGVSLLLAIGMCTLDTSEKCGRLSKLILIDSAGYPDHLPIYLKVMRTPVLGWVAVHTIPPKCQIRIVLNKSYAEKCRITQDQIDTYAAPIAEKNGRYALLQLAKGTIPKNIQWYIDQYPKITVPTLILWGDDDRVLPPLIGERLDLAIPHSSLQYIKSAGHVPQEEQPYQVICKIRKFLDPSTRCEGKMVPSCERGEEHTR